MDIKDNRNLCENFGNLNVGDVFHLDNVKKFYMKIETILGVNSDEIINAINILDGVEYYFNDSKTVYPVKCKLVIE